MRRLSWCLVAATLVACTHAPKAAAPATPALPQVSPTPGRAAAMDRLSFMRGVWAGTASGMTPDGHPYKVTQVERMGPMLGGDVIVIEGRGFRDDKSTAFNALAVVSWDPRAQRYEMRSYAQGMAGTFELKPTPDGYTWEFPAGPGAVMRYTATVCNGLWHEIGEYIAGSQPPRKMFEMNLKRVGDSDWPLVTPVGPEVAPSTVEAPVCGER